MSSDKLSIVKNYKFTPETLQLFEQALKGLHEKPEETEALPNGEVKISQEYQMQKIIDIGLLSLEMNLAVMKDSLAATYRYDLEKEAYNTQMGEKLTEAMDKMKDFKWDR